MRIASLVVTLAFFGCEEPREEGPAPSRFAAAKRSSDTAAERAAKSFCEVTFPRGETGRTLAAPPERPVPGTAAPTPTTNGRWRWVNLWATWCRPCVEEMGLLTKWRDSLGKDGVAIDMEMWSVDDDEAALVEFLKSHTLPGQVRWLRSSQDMPAFLEALGADKASPIPVHALVDDSAHVRCVRVGSVHDEDYAAVKALLAGG